VLQIELVPDISNCVETVTRREYEETVRQLLAAEEGHEELLERIELLRLFLETIDFKKLRRESEKDLVEGKKVKFVVYLEGGTPKYDMRVT